MDPTIFADDERVMEFKPNADDLFADHDGEAHNLIMESIGMVGVRLYRPDPYTLTFDRSEPPNGMRSASVDLKGLDQYDRFRVLLSWSPEELGLDIGPHPPVEGELRTATGGGSDGS